MHHRPIVIEDICANRSTIYNYYRALVETVYLSKCKHEIAISRIIYYTEIHLSFYLENFLSNNFIRRLSVRQSGRIQNIKIIFL